MHDFIEKLIEIGAIKFGEFKLKSGNISPIYFDFRSLVSYPSLLKTVSDKMWELCGPLYHEGKFTHICGVPYTALPLATVISVFQDIPMILKRKEAKSYGTASMVEGVYEQGTKCIIIEDVVTTGMSVIETVTALKEYGIVVTDVIVLLDRMQGGSENLTQNGIKIHSLIQVDKFLKMASESKFITNEAYNNCIEFLFHNKFSIANDSQSVVRRFSEIRNITKSDFNKRLLDIIFEKKTNIAVAADLTSCQEILNLANSVGPHICLLKTHIDIIHDFNEEFLLNLKKLSKEHNFLLFEDRKFSDIGNTVHNQLKCQHYNIFKYFDLINAHIFPGVGVIEGLKKDLEESNVSLLLVSEMSSEGNFFDERIREACLNYANQYSSFISGFICQKKLDNSGKFIHMTPGVSLETKTDSLKQTYRTIPEVIESGADVVILGRSIISGKDPVEAVMQAKDMAYSALVSRGAL